MHILKCTKNAQHCSTNVNFTRTLLVYMDFCIIQGFKQVTMLLFSSPWSYSLLHYKAFSVKKKFTMVKKHYLRCTHMWNYHNNIVVKHHSINVYWARNHETFSVHISYFYLLSNWWFSVIQSNPPARHWIRPLCIVSLLGGRRLSPWYSSKILPSYK